MYAPLIAQTAVLVRTNVNINYYYTTAVLVQVE